MDRRHSKRVKGILMMLVISVIVISFYCFLDRDTVKVRADQIGNLKFFVGGEPKSNGDVVPYTDDSKIVRLLATAPIGSTYDWHINDPRIISIKSGNGTDSVTFNINSPGYSGLTVTITTPDGTESKTFYCDIHVPLEWDTSNLTTDRTNYGYGLLYANNGDGDYTLQLYTENTSIAVSQTKRYSHYLRKIKNINYYYKGDDPETSVIETTATTAESDVTSDNLAPYTAALKWESSDYSVVDIDSNGVLLAKAAGFATVKVSTDTKSKYGEYDTLSFDVVVVPEVTKLSDSTGHAYTPDSTLSAGYTDYTKVVKGFNDSVMTIETNASKADMLDWHVLRASGVSYNDITASMGKDIQISDVSGTVVISNLKAGVYFVTASPKKANGQGYDTVRSYINTLKYKVIVPVNYPPTDITLGYYSEDFKDTYNLLEHSNIPTGMFEYEVPFNLQQYAKMGSSEGVVEAVSEGHATVKIKQLATAFNNYFSEYATDPALTNYYGDTLVNVTVYGGVLLNSSLVSIPVGKTFQLELVAPQNYTGQVTWSSDAPNTASVDQSTGLVTAKSEGETTVKVVLNDGNGVTRQAKCIIKVVKSINSISLTAQYDHISVGGSMVISATVDPNLSTSSLEWTVSDTSKAVINPQTGSSVTITGKSAGNVVVTALNPENGKYGSIVISVNAEITGVTIDPSSITVSSSSGPIQLFASVTPGLPYGEKLVWESSDSSIADVDSNGKVTVKKSGIAYIYVRTENGKSAYCTIKVLQEMEGIILDKTELVMHVGEMERLTYTVNPSTTSNNALIWSSSDSNIATVSNNGLITAKNTGTCTITARSQDGSGIMSSCLVRVVRDATSIKLDVTALNINVGENFQLDAKLDPADSTDDLYFESSNTKIATVTSNGKVTGKAAGNCVIFVKTGSGKYDYCYVEVAQQVTSLELNQDSAEMHIGEMLELTATINPDGATDPAVEWESSNEKVATVSSKGIVKAISTGATVIKCTSLDGDYMAICLVTVVDGTRTVTITVNKSATVGVGKKYTLTAIVDGVEVPANTLKWSSSNKKICKVTKSGVIKGVATGKCKITVKMKDGSIGSAKCTVKVINATNSISLNKSYVEILQGRTLKLTATTSPKKTTYAPRWESSDETIAVVSKKGTITAIKPGEVTIKCYAKDNPEVYATCRVVVTAPVSITSFNFSDDAIVLLPGETSNIQYTISPTNYTEGFTWISDNPVAVTVDSKGKVTARAVGSATITAMSDSGKKSTINVYVVGLSKSKITLHQYESTKIKLEVDGVKKGELDIRWDTDNQSIAEMSNGKVTGKALGTTTVYCVVNGRYLACTVKVIKN